MRQQVLNDENGHGIRKRASSRGVCSALPRSELSCSMSFLVTGVITRDKACQGLGCTFSCRRLKRAIISTLHLLGIYIFKSKSAAFLGTVRRKSDWLIAFLQSAQIERKAMGLGWGPGAGQGLLPSRVSPQSQVLRGHP